MERPKGIIERINKKLTVPLAEKLKDKYYITPNRITWISFIIAGILAPFMILEKHFIIASILVLIGAWLDSLDGDLARVRKQTSKEGEILDAVLDRYVDLLIISAMIFVERDCLIAGLFALIGSSLVPYVRARTEAAGKKSISTFGSRDIRNIILVVGLISGMLCRTLWVLAIVANLSACHRFYYAIRREES